MSSIFLSPADFAVVRRVLGAGSKSYGAAAVERLSHAFAACAGLAPAIAPKSPEQRPELVIPGLTERPWYEASDFSFCRDVEACAAIVQTEFQNVMRSATSLQQVQRDHYVPAGRWDALFIRVGNTWVEANRRLCPQTFRLTESIPRLSQVSMISVLSAGGHIAPHCGRWNCRLTLHLGLSIPGNCGLRVGSETRMWEPGKLLAFDDTFEHEAWNRSDQPRCVLLFDVWHPDLSDVEVGMLEQLREEGIHDGMATVADRKDEPAGHQKSHYSDGADARLSASSARPGGVSLDWSRLAEPQADQYDTNVILWLDSAIRGTGRQEAHQRTPAGDSPTVFDGAVAVRHVYRFLPEFKELSARYPDGPADDPNIALAAGYVRSWGEAFQQCQRLLEAIHPAIDPTRPLRSDDVYRGAVSCSFQHLFGTLWSTIFCPFGLAEAIVREMANQKLRVLGAALGLAPSAMNAIQAPYSDVHVATLDLYLFEALRDPAKRRAFGRVLQKNLTRIEEGNASLRTQWQNADAGREFIGGIVAWTEKTVQMARALETGERNPMTLSRPV